MSHYKITRLLLVSSLMGLGILSMSKAAAAREGGQTNEGSTSPEFQKWCKDHYDPIWLEGDASKGLNEETLKGMKKCRDFHATLAPQGQAHEEEDEDEDEEGDSHDLHDRGEEHHEDADPEGEEDSEDHEDHAYHAPAGSSGHTPVVEAISRCLTEEGKIRHWIEELGTSQAERKVKKLWKKDTYFTEYPATLLTYIEGLLSNPAPEAIHDFDSYCMDVLHNLHGKKEHYDTILMKTERKRVQPRKKGQRKERRQLRGHSRSGHHRDHPGPYGAPQGAYGAPQQGDGPGIPFPYPGPGRY